mgnify:CR=1 FL=1
MKPRFFSDQNEFRSWLRKHHRKEKELWVGFYKVASGLPSMTWSESVDQALCYGWIDGLRKSIDEKSYMIRFTPRNPKSNWSDINIKKVAELTKKRLMRAAGLRAFEKLDKKKSRFYAFEQKNAALDKKYKSELKRNKKAWSYYQSAPPSYKKQVSWWIMSAKKEETRLRRLKILIAHCAKEAKIPQAEWKKKKG